MSQPDASLARMDDGGAGPQLGDAFGAVIVECWEQGGTAGRVFEVIERDDGFLNVADAARYFAEPDAWGPLDRWACSRARGRVLDIGSGAGRHALYLQSQELPVVALDVSSLAVEICRQRGVQHVAVSTAADLARSGTQPFDTFLLLGNNLGLLASAEEAPRLLATLAALACPDAIIIGQGTDPYQTQAPEHLAYHQRNRRRGRMAGQLRLRVRHRQLATPWFDYLFVSLDELMVLFAGTGWVLEQAETAGPHYAVVLRYAL